MRAVRCSVVCVLLAVNVERLLLEQGFKTLPNISLKPLFNRHSLESIGEGSCLNASSYIKEGLSQELFCDSPYHLGYLPKPYPIGVL